MCSRRLSLTPGPVSTTRTSTTSAILLDPTNTVVAGGACLQRVLQDVAEHPVEQASVGPHVPRLRAEFPLHPMGLGERGDGLRDRLAEVYALQPGHEGPCL